MIDSKFKLEAAEIIGERISRLRALTWEAVAEHPDETRDEIVVAEQKCTLGTFTISLYGQPVLLVAVQISAGRANEKPTFYMERGLVSSPHSPVREAAEKELRDTGGGNSMETALSSC